MTEHPEEDVAIQATLEALGQATPPDQMQDRLLRRLQQESATEVTSPHRFLPYWKYLGEWPAMLTVSTIAVAVVFTAALLHGPGRQRQSTAKVATLASPQADTTLPKHMAHDPYAHPSRSSMVSLREVSVAAMQPRNGVPVTPPSLEEASFPPPPMPLTDQEKLLRRIAHHGDPVELAALDTQHLNAAFEAQKEQFNDFFYIHPREPNDDNQPQQ